MVNTVFFPTEGVLRLLTLSVFLSLCSPTWAQVLYPLQFVDHFTATPPAPPVNVELNRFLHSSVKGGTLRIATNEAMRSIFPTYIREGKITLRAPHSDWFIYESLLTFDAREVERTGRAFAARRVRATPDLCTVEVDLDPAFAFSDGTPARAEDVQRSLVYKFTRFNSGAGEPLMKQLYGRVGSMVVSPLTFRMEFHDLPRSRCRQAAFYLLTSMRIVKENPQPNLGGDITMDYLGTGPYRVVKASSALIRYERRMDYWAKDHPLRRGLFNPDAIEIAHYADPLIQRFALLRGELSLYRENGFGQAAWMDAQMQTHPIALLKQRAEFLDLGIEGVFMNQSREHTGRVAFRRAMLLAWNLPEANRSFFEGRREAVIAPGALSPFAAHGPPSAAVASLLQTAKDDPAFDEVLKPIERMGYALWNPATLPRRERLRIALILLRHDGYHFARVGGRTRLTRDGSPVVLNALLQYGAPETRMFLLFQKDLADLGIELKLQPVFDRATLMSAARANSHDFMASAIYLSRDFTTVEGNYLIHQLHSRNVKESDSGASSKLLDATLEAVDLKDPSSPEFKVAADALLRALNANVPLLLSGEISPVLTYHQRHVHLWDRQANDLHSLYITP